MVSLEKYPCFCTEANIKTFTSRKGQTFAKCKTGGCNLFTPSDKYHELYAIYEQKVEMKYRPYNFPLCYCDQPVSLWVSHSIANPLRPYFRCCQTKQNRNCGYFLWADRDGEQKPSKTVKRPAKGSKAKKRKAGFKRVKRILESSDEDENKDEIKTETEQ